MLPRNKDQEKEDRIMYIQKLELLTNHKHNEAVRKTSVSIENYGLRVAIRNFRLYKTFHVI